MKQLPSANHGLVSLSDERYKIMTNRERGCLLPENYRKGTVVRLISGVDGNEKPGYHFNSKYVTVCREDATYAEFIGLKKTSILLLEHYEHL